MNNEELIRNSIDCINKLSGKIIYEIKESKDYLTIYGPLNGADAYYINITIFRDGNPLFTTSYPLNQPEYRESAFSRMLQELVFSGLLHHPSSKEIINHE